MKSATVRTAWKISVMLPTAPCTEGWSSMALTTFFQAVVSPTGKFPWPISPLVCVAKYQNETAQVSLEVEVLFSISSMMYCTDSEASTILSLDEPLPAL
ncbi:hypothetical protein D3C81_1077600 [compost metagenome]